MTRRRGEKSVNVPTANFPGLIELVWNEKSSRVEFWCPRPKSPGRSKSPGRFWFVERVVQPGGGDRGEAAVWVPPSVRDLPWLLPRRAEVERYLLKDSDPQYFQALCDWIESNVQLPKPEHVTLLAAWIIHSHIVDLAFASPYILLLGPPDAGKSRTLECCIHAARRGILWMTARDASLIRAADDFGATIALDVTDFMRAIGESVDFFTARSKNNGTKTTRILDPQQGSFGGARHFSAYGATIVASNRAVMHEAIASRCFPILAREADRPFRQPITPELALPLRERGVAFRARMLKRESRGELPAAPDLGRHRLGELLAPLAQVVQHCAPDRLAHLRTLSKEFADERRIAVQESLEVEVLRHSLALFDGVPPDQPGLYVKLEALVHNLNAERRQTGERLLSSWAVGPLLRTHFGIKPEPGTGNYTFVTLKRARLIELAAKYGLQFRPPGPQTAAGRIPMMAPKARERRKAALVESRKVEAEPGPCDSDTAISQPQGHVVEVVKKQETTLPAGIRRSPRKKPPVVKFVTKLRRRSSSREGDPA